MLMTANSIAPCMSLTLQLHVGTVSIPAREVDSGGEYVDIRQRTYWCMLDTETEETGEK